MTTLPTPFEPGRLAAAAELADRLAQSQFVPTAFRGKPSDVLSAVLYGLELGLGPLQALRVIAIVNGRPAIWGDGLLAICQRHPAYQGIDEHLEGEGEQRRAVCTVRRAPDQIVTRTFSVADARRAQLWGKAGPWSQYPERMLQMRARSWALRDAFADALCGLVAVEEAADVPDTADTPPRTATAAEAIRARLRQPEVIATAEPVEEPTTPAPAAPPAEDGTEFVADAPPRAPRRRLLSIVDHDGSTLSVVSTARHWAAGVRQHQERLAAATVEERFGFARNNIATARALAEKFPGAPEVAEALTALERWLPPEDRPDAADTADADAGEPDPEQDTLL